MAPASLGATGTSETATAFSRDTATSATARGGSILFAGKLFTYATRLVITVLLARALGSTGYGVYNVALTVAELAVIGAALGLDSGLVRFVAIAYGRRDERRLWSLLQIGIALPTVLSILFGAAIYALAGTIAVEVFHEPGLADPMRLATLAIPVLVLLNQLDAAVRAFGRMDYAVLTQQFIQPLLRLTLIVLLLVIGITVPLAVAAFIFSVAVATTVLVVLLDRQFSIRRAPHIDVSDVTAIGAFSLPVYLSSLVTAIGPNIQKFMLGALASVASVGIFAVASQLNLIGSVFHSSVTMAAMPVIATLHDRGQHQELGALYRTVTKWAITVNLPVFLIMVMLARPLLEVFGPGFGSGAGILAILAAANLANVATGPCGAMLDMSGHTRWKLFNAVVLVVVSVTTSLLLIPSLGLVGAAVTSLVVSVVLNVIRVVEVRALLGLHPFDRSTAKPVVAALIAFVVASAAATLAAGAGTALAALVTAAVAVATYAVLIVRLGISVEDRALLARVGARLRRRIAR